MVAIGSRIRIRIAILVRCTLAEVCTVPVLLLVALLSFCICISVYLYVLRVRFGFYINNNNNSNHILCLYWLKVFPVFLNVNFWRISLFSTTEAVSLFALIHYFSSCRTNLFLRQSQQLCFWFSLDVRAHTHTHTHHESVFFPVGLALLINHS